MHDKTLEELAYFRIRDEISGFCVANESRELMLKRKPLTEIEKIEYLKDLGREWTTLLNSTKNSFIQSWNDIHSFLGLLTSDGATLEQEQFFALLTFSLSVKSAYTSINSASKTLNIKKLLSLTEKIPLKEIDEATKQISFLIDKDGKLKDVPVLKEIRKKINSIQQEISLALKKYTSDSSLNSVLASNVPAFRADRQVIAVKANQRNFINGIVHEVSASGQTLFIEPEEVVRKNNELLQEEFNLNTQIRKLFTELTAKIFPYAKDFKQALFIMEELDQSCAAARWAQEHNCTYAKLCTDENPPHLIQARHPLLGQVAVPIDMEFIKGKRILVITGPNTGGKTVAIKTFALFSMLNQAGFPIPASEGTCLPIFDAVFADIGDEQSIDQSLSTFSAHMKNIAAAVKHATKDSLVLLDELGSGTDPQEGGAIGMAILKNLVEKKSFVLVTTHHGVLKNFAYTNESCINASVDFDTNTLRATYRILTGIPGESHALEIAKQSGLPFNIVETAKSYITGNEADVSSLIKGLTQKHSELNELEKTARARELLLKEKELKFQQKMLTLQERELEIRQKEQQDSSDFLIETRKKLENLVRVLREGEITREKTLGVKQFIAELTGQIEKNANDLENDWQNLENQKKELEVLIKNESIRTENGMLILKENSKHSTSSKKNTRKKLSAKEAFKNAKPAFSDEEAAILSAKLDKSKIFTSKSKKMSQIFSEGAEVIHIPTKTRGTIISEVGKNTYLVQLGSIKMTVKQKDLQLTEISPRTTAISVELVGENGIKSTPEFELRLLGLREEEAIKALERQLDLCAMSNFKNFSVIHGKGNGILQQAVQDYLGQYPAVKKFYYARPEDGGTGKTYVELI